MPAGAGPRKTRLSRQSGRCRHPLWPRAICLTFQCACAESRMGNEGGNPCMSSFARDEQRRVVPRWRFLSDHTRAEELSGDPRRSRIPEYDQTYLEQRLLDWQRMPSFATAADLLTGAM